MRREGMKEKGRTPVGEQAAGFLSEVGSQDRALGEDDRESGQRPARQAGRLSWKEPHNLDEHTHTITVK